MKTDEKTIANSPPPPPPLKVMHQTQKYDLL